MTDDVLADARRLLQGITPGPWHAILCGSCEDRHANGVWSVGAADAVVEDEVNLRVADAEFIAAAPALVQDLLDALDQKRYTMDRDELEQRFVNTVDKLDAANATIARIQAVAADVDQDGGHSGPTLARHILNIIGGEA